MKQADEIVRIIKEEVAKVIEEGGEEAEMKKTIEKRLPRSMNDLIGRTPLVLPVFMSI
jgi:hypothetical protein